jgi:lipopolysaccharide transport system ATP-binding protein
MTDPIISVAGLSKLYPLGKQGEVSLGLYRDLLRPLFRGLAATPSPQDEPPEGMFWALRGVTFDVREGERIGIIGRNGAGKSTLLKILSRVSYPTAGEAVIRGRVTSLLEVGTGFNDSLSGRENIYLNAGLHGLSREEVDGRLDAIIDFSELRRFIDGPLRHYSTGMRARLAFSVAAHLDPDILILDEVLSVGDLAFQQKCIERMNEISGQSRTLLFVSHSMSSLRQFCSRGIWLERGRILMDGGIDDVVADYAKDALRLTGGRQWDEEAGETEEAARAGEAPSPSAAEGNEAPAARLVSASVIAGGNRDVATITADEAISIEAVYDVLREDITVFPSFRFYNEHGVLIFTAAYSDPDTEPLQAGVGRYEARVEIPAHFLNIGRITVSIGLNSPVSGALKRHHVAEEALALFVHEVPYPGRSARGPYPEVKGAVRPIFRWEVGRIGDNAGEQRVGDAASAPSSPLSS